MTTTLIVTVTGPLRTALRRGARAGLLGALLLSGACNSILDVKAPDIVTPDNLGGPAGLATLRAGALGDYALALGGSAAGHGATPALIHYSGVFSDEFDYSGTFPTRREPDERRVQPRNGSMLAIYQNLHRARAAAANAAIALRNANPSDFRVAEMEGLVSLTFSLFGEHYCSGVPFSSTSPSGDLVLGTPLATAAMFDSAVVWADRALAAAPPGSRQASLAAVAKGRALLNLGRFADAGTAVTAVPSDFVYLAEFSDKTRRETSGLYQLTVIDRQFSVAERKGGGLPYRTAADPRVRWSEPGVVGQDGITNFFQQLRFPDPGSAIPTGDGVEARLIEAEAALKANNLPRFKALHDALRARVGLPSVDPTPMTADQRVDFHFRERAFWLYLTAHRVGDMRRLVRQYGRAVGAVFPTGAYFKGGVYGTDVNFPVPVEEENNPNFTGCLDRNP